MTSEMRLIIGTNIQWEIYNLYTGERKADSINESAFYFKKDFLFDFGIDYYIIEWIRSARFYSFTVLEKWLLM